MKVLTEILYDLIFWVYVDSIHGKYWRKNIGSLKDTAFRATPVLWLVNQSLQQSIFMFGRGAFGRIISATESGKKCLK